MPLDTIEDPFELSSFECVKQDFVIFYAGRDDDGVMWCPDCRDVEETIERTFAPLDGPTGLIVYVGQRVEWKTGANFFRAAPWHIRSIPTVVKIQGAEEAGRLVEGQIASDLFTFIGSPVPPTEDESPTKNEPATKGESVANNVPVIKDEPPVRDELPVKGELPVKDELPIKDELSTKDETATRDKPPAKDEPPAKDS